MATDRRYARTPFTYRAAGEFWGVYASNGIGVAMVTLEKHAAFICKACNRYDALLEIFDLCRGRHDNLTMPYTSAHDKAFDVLSKKMDDEISRNGR